MKKKHFYIGLVLIFLCSCITLNKNKVTRVYHEPLDYKALADSIKSEVAKRHGDYIFFQSGLTRSAYIIYKDSVWYYLQSEGNTSLEKDYRTFLYKINTEGIYLYHSFFWSSLAYNNLSETFETILNDSINPTEYDLGVYISHAETFLIESKSGDNISRRGGHYYLLRQEQPLGLLISRVERSLWLAEQDWQHWKKVRGQEKCIN